MDLNILTRDIHREHDACGIFAQIDKLGRASRDTVDAGLCALSALKHRAGYVHNEGDGCGLMLDVPKGLWSRWLSDAGVDPASTDNPRFFVAHLFLDRETHPSLASVIRDRLADAGCEVLCWRSGETNDDALGPIGRAQAPVFVQIAALAPKSGGSRLMQMTHALETIKGIHVASLDRDTVVYKVIGDGQTLSAYYLDLQDAACTTSFVMAHTRYSTNTKTSFERVQPFRTLGHNGEINTIARFFEEVNMLGFRIDPSGSDSQMVAQAVEHLIRQAGWSLFETAELLFPPILHEIKGLPRDLQDTYMFLRSLWGPFAQGPAAVMMKAGAQAVFSVDALGLRPLWWIETDEAYVASSEQGIVPPETWTADPKPLSPGEKVGVEWAVDGRVLVFGYSALQRLVHQRLSARFDVRGQHKAIRPPGRSLEASFVPPFTEVLPWKVRAAAFGWREAEERMVRAYASSGAEPIHSLGFDEPIAALAGGFRAVSDFIQETVAVVTNPAIDREREVEHFSTRILLGPRPALDGQSAGRHIELPSPLLLQATLPNPHVNADEMLALAHRKGTVCYEDVLHYLHEGPYGVVEILTHRLEGESIPAYLDRICREAVEAVQAGAHLIVLDDRLQFVRGAFVDVHLALAAVHKALLRPASGQGGEHLRRRTSLVVRSASLRSLHDIMVAIGLGADAVNPYLLWGLSADAGDVQGIDNAFTALCKGMEKVLSTLGIHELRGYERLFSAIGLHEEVAEVLGIPNFCGGQDVGYGFTQMEAEAADRQAVHDVHDEKSVGRQRSFHLYPRIWKSATQVADGSLPYDAYVEKLEGFEHESPIHLRHTLRLKKNATVQPIDEESVDTSIDGHAYPFIISSMSFGSQGEVPFRAYAEAASRLNIVAMNGEGGEVKDLLTKYPRHRGRQIASGRFGVNAELCNGAYVLEIKIGQGAKPGEGGHLPGSKVTLQVASARNASPGIDLISPSNNHDIYSIEDLAQVVGELKAVNPTAKIAVKVPVVPNIGTIAVGIVKAGADIVELSGFDGGTGAARAHAIRHVGLPVDIGIKLTHDALCDAGLRDCVEIWADGGMKSGQDVMKAILMGANRVGFGTMAMVALGCTACRACHQDTCHVGIATQIADLEEAQARGLKQFAPQMFDLAVERLERWFTAIGNHIRALTAQLGTLRTQDLVGRSDLLEPFAHRDRVDLAWLTQVDHRFQGQGTRIAYRSAALAHETAEDEAVASMVSGDVAWLGSELPTGYRGGHSALDRFASHRHAKRLYSGPVGNGFAAYQTTGDHAVVFGGGQDGIGKGAYGGRTIVLKHRLGNGKWVGGSVGKGLAYGAQRGLFIVQGNADARAGIRLSGADVIIGGELRQPLQDGLGYIGSRANIAGFAFEYMTAGRALVLGDPGPWICSGMSGGTVYIRLQPALGFDEAALKRRIAKGAKVGVFPVDVEGESDLIGLLSAYEKELRKSGQAEAAHQLTPLIDHPREHFMMIRPSTGLTDQDIATE